MQKTEVILTVKELSDLLILLLSLTFPFFVGGIKKKQVLIPCITEVGLDNLKNCRSVNPDLAPFMCKNTEEFKLSQCIHIFKKKKKKQGSRKFSCARGEMRPSVLVTGRGRMSSRHLLN